MSVCVSLRVGCLPCSSVHASLDARAAPARSPVPPGEAAVPSVAGDGGVAVGHDRHWLLDSGQGTHRSCCRSLLFGGVRPGLRELGK